MGCRRPLSPAGRRRLHEVLRLRGRRLRRDLRRNRRRAARGHGRERRRRRRLRPRRPLHRARGRTADAAAKAGEVVARKLRGFERILDAPALFAVAYGEIASSIYFALGIVAANALGFTPVVLLLTGALFLVVSLSYAEGTAAIPETGGAATMVRRASNDFFGFLTGWALFLDYLIVIAL